VETPLVVSINHQKERERDGRTTAVVLQWFEYRRANGEAIVVPSRYVTDFASIPWFARWFIPPFGRHSIAAVLHDWLYTVGQPGRRDYADQVLWEALLELKVHRLQRWVVHTVVRIWGQRGYERAEGEWDLCVFMDWRTGAWLKPLWARSAFFDGGAAAVIGEIKAQRR
jgi:hypothetical protein